MRKQTIDIGYSLSIERRLRIKKPILTFKKELESIVKKQE